MQLHAKKKLEVDLTQDGPLQLQTLAHTPSHFYYSVELQLLCIQSSIKA